MSCLTEKQPSLYKPRRSEKTDLHVTIRKNLSKWNRQKEPTDSIPIHVQKEFEGYLKCGILAHGFAKACCKTCDKEFFLAFSCKRRGVCPFCNQKRMVAVATHLIEEVIPKVRMRQYVISFPKRIRPYLKNKEIRKKVLKIVVGKIEKQIIDRSTSVLNARAGGVSFFQRFGSSINFHPHFHICFTDGVPVFLQNHLVQSHLLKKSGKMKVSYVPLQKMVFIPYVIQSLFMNFVILFQGHQMVF